MRKNKCYANFIHKTEENIMKLKSLISLNKLFAKSSHTKHQLIYHDPSLVKMII